MKDCYQEKDGKFVTQTKYTHCPHHWVDQRQKIVFWPKEKKEVAKALHHWSPVDKVNWGSYQVLDQWLVTDRDNAAKYVKDLVLRESEASDYGIQEEYIHIIPGKTIISTAWMPWKHYF